MDAVASLYGRNHLGDIIERTARDIFVPLTVGGGMRTIDDIRTVLRAGADKVAINTGAIQRPEFISDAANTFGSSTIIVAIEAIREPDGRYFCFTDSGREASGLEAVAWARRAADLGAGELSVTSVDREGTGKGFDIDLLRRISDAVRIPVIGHGGAGAAAHLRAAAIEGRVSAVMMASMLHYHAVKQMDWSESEFRDEGNIEFIRRKASFANVSPMRLQDLRAALIQDGVEVRDVR
jgi:cyclase